MNFYHHNMRIAGREILWPEAESLLIQEFGHAKELPDATLYYVIEFEHPRVVAVEQDRIWPYAYDSRGWFTNMSLRVREPPIITKSPEFTRDKNGHIVTEITNVFPAVTQEVVEKVASDPNIVGVVLTSPTRKFQQDASVELCTECVSLPLVSDKLFMSRDYIFGNIIRQ